jgi:hypothetical protein
MTDDLAPDEVVRAAMAKALEAGRELRPTVTAAALRRRAWRTHFPRIDTKLVGALAAVLVLVVTLIVAGPLRSTQPHLPTTKRTAPRGWVAYSAYGLQVSIPKSWAVQPFGQCPRGNTLFIETAQFVANCPEFGSGGTVVSMAAKPDPYTASHDGSTAQDNAAASAVYSADVAATQNGRYLIVNGLRVLQARTGSDLLWVIPFKSVVLTGSGPAAEKMMRTLATATTSATPAPGTIYGTAYLSALVRAPITGRVTYVRIHPIDKGLVAHSVGVLNGNYSASLTPGTYRFTTADGNAQCPSVSVKVESGRMITAPPIVCQGM